MRIALFPGQGSLRPGMGLPWRDHPSSVLIDEISSVAGVDVRHLVDDADSEELVRTDNAQLATFALSAVVAHAANIDDVDVAIGHSLGEYSALCFAGILDLGAATTLVVARGSAMAEASAARPGTMAAVLGADDETLRKVLEAFSSLVVANQNAPGQTVVAGSLDDVSALRERARDFGLKRVMPLEVGGAFHSPLMEPARAPLEAALASTTFHQGSIPVIANVDAAQHAGGDVWRTLLLNQLTGAVQFQASVEAVGGHHNEFIELGPGGVLTGLVKRIDTDATLRTLATPDDVESFKGESHEH